MSLNEDRSLPGDQHRRGTCQGVEVGSRRVLVRAGVEERNHITARSGGRFHVPSEKIKIARLTYNLYAKPKRLRFRE